MKQEEKGQVMIYQSNGSNESAQKEMAERIRTYMEGHPADKIGLAVIDQNKSGVKITLFMEGK